MIRKEWNSVEAVYLYGSALTAPKPEGSDIDLAVLSKEPVSAQKRWEMAQQLASFLKTDVDLADLRRSSTVFQFQVISTGRRIDCSDLKASEDFETYVYSDYARLNEERKEILDEIQKRGRIY